MTEETSTSKLNAYYKQKGLIRHTVVFSEDCKKKVETLAKLHHVSQGDVIDVALEELFKIDAAPLLAVKRDNKVDGRKGGAKKADAELLKKIKQLDPKQLEALLANVK